MSDERLTSLSDHPRASAAIKRAKAWAGLGGFLFVALLGVSQGAALDAVLERALIGGIVANVLVWAAAVGFWKRVLVGEATAAARRARERAAAE